MHSRLEYSKTSDPLGARRVAKQQEAQSFLRDSHLASLEPSDSVGSSVSGEST